MAPSLRTTTRSLALLGLALTAACGDGITGVERQDVPFYYHFDERIYLRADDRELIVATLEQDSAAVAEGLERVGLSAESIRYFRPIDATHHWRVRLEGDEDTSRLSVRLWQRRDFVFAAPVYFTREHDSRMELVDRLVVQAADGVSAGDIGRMAADYGLAYLGPGSFASPTYVFALPASADVTVLELAAAIHRRPEVEWAEVDRVSQMVFPQGLTAR